MRRCLTFLCVTALLLTACGGSPEEQMYAAALDVHFNSPDRYALLKHQVIAIQPTFTNAPQQAVPPGIISMDAGFLTCYGEGPGESR